ncbi:hypothetical protein ACP4OV_022426 [Aristida adscensionis]
MDEGYLWCPGQEMAMVKATVDQLKVAMDECKTCMSRMCETREMQEDQRAQYNQMKALFVANSAMAPTNSKKMNALFVAVFLLFVGVVLMK